MEPPIFNLIIFNLSVRGIRPRAPSKSEKWTEKIISLLMTSLKQELISVFMLFEGSDDRNLETNQLKAKRSERTSSILPPWKEFCRMLGRNGCGRYMRWRRRRRRRRSPTASGCDHVIDLTWLVFLVEEIHLKRTSNLFNSFESC